MPAVTVYHDDGTTETIPATVGWSHKREVGHMWKLKITVERSQAQAVSLTEKRDEVELAGVRRGVLTDIQNGGATWTLTVRSPEWYATQQTPTLGGDRRQGDDNTLLTTLINAVPQWSVGSVATLTGPMTYVFNHAFANEAMRKIEKNVPGELQWADDGTVNYVDRLGTDKSASVTLSPSAGNLEDGITIKDRGRRLDATHVRVIGAHEGEAQRFAQLVPQADPNTYENEVRYTQPRWNGPEDTDWDRWQNKDVMAEDTIFEEAESLGEELTEPNVEATATAVGEDLAVGDEVRVVKPDAGLDRTMRIHRITTKTKSDTTAAVVDELLLSTRTVLRDDAGNDGRDIQRFNTGFQGSSVAVNGGPVIAGVDNGDPLTFPFPYPNLEYENTAEIIVQGLPYRIDSVPNEHSHIVDVTHPSHSHGMSHNHIVGISDTSTENTPHGDVVANGKSINTPSDTGGGWVDLDIISPLTSYEVALVWVSTSTADSSVEVRLKDANRTKNYPTSDGVLISGSFTTESGSVLLSIPEDVGSVIVQYKTDAAPNSNFLLRWQFWGEHTHDVSDTVTSEPSSITTSEAALGTTESVTSGTAAGITEGIYKTGDTPSNVDMAINGTTVATNIGSGQFQATVDVSGEFTVGQSNDITISSDTLGRVLVTPYIRGYDQIGTRN